jgi:glycosyltransferase involved in cell wall biosynthesis
MIYPKISIVTPSYNQGCFIEETILSVLDQSYPNLEFIIVDGGSTDNTVDIIKKHEKYLTWWVSEKDKGQSDAINKGLKKCTGEIFNWLCSDDYFEAGTLKEIAELFKDNSVRLVSGNFRYIGGNYPPDSILEGIVLEDTPEKSFARVAMTQPATFWRLPDIQKFGGVNETVHYFMDLELVFKYLLYYGLTGIVKTDKTFANYRLHPVSKTSMQMDVSKILPGSSFNIDKNNMFYFLAKKYNPNIKTLKALKSLMNSVDEAYCMESLPEMPVLDIRIAINYYLYDFLRRYYYSKNISAANNLAWKINGWCLEKEDRKGLGFLRKQLLFKKIF